MDIQELGTGSENTTGSPVLIRVETPNERRNRLQREYRRDNYASVRESEKRSQLKHADAKKAYMVQWRRENMDKRRETSRRFYWANREKRLADSRNRRINQRAKFSEQRKRLYQLNKTKINAACDKWWKDHPEKAREKYLKYLPRRQALRKHRRLTEPQEKIKDACRNRMGTLLRRAKIKKIERTFDFIGCTPSFLKEFLESKFTLGMSWENHGTFWEIDHVIPVSLFNLVDEVERRKAFHYTNCQPLEKMANRMKGNRLPISSPPLTPISTHGF